ncbi:MAG: PKD domain-containing protein [Candidatus Binatia bacterium]
MNKLTLATGFGWFLVAASTLAVGLLALAQPAPAAQQCPLPQGFWKDNPSAWPLTSLTLGSQSYTQAELLTILNTAVGSGKKADASLILADQLIAAKLNLANGANSDPLSTITDADMLLSEFSGKLPYMVKPSSASGKAMVTDAKALESYNSEGIDLGTSCTVGVGACQRDGVNVCALDGRGTVCDATSGSPTPEVCNGSDDDCNGLVDDGLGTLSCGTGACARTVAACVGGVPQSCVPGSPSSEVCNGVDDNCDGQIDDGLGTISCGAGACSRTVDGCVSGQPQECIPGQPSAEVCDNHVDDDCNGIVDDPNVCQPMAHVQTDHTIRVGVTIHLDGSGSTSPHGTPLTYQWTLVGTPTGSQSYIGESFSAIAAFAPDLPGTYTIQLIVNDGVLDSGPDTVQITATDNKIPIANAGPDQTSAAGTTVTLDGSGSSDPEGTSLTYHWTLVSQPSGSKTTLTGDNTVTPSFVADIAGVYILLLRVSDEFGSSVPNTVRITAGQSLPSCDISPPLESQTNTATDWASTTLGPAANPWASPEEFISLFDLVESVLGCTVKAPSQESSLILQEQFETSEPQLALQGALGSASPAPGVNYCGPGTSETNPFLLVVTAPQCLNEGCYEHDKCYQDHCIDSGECLWSPQARVICDQALADICTAQCWQNEGGASVAGVICHYVLTHLGPDRNLKPKCAKPACEGKPNCSNGSCSGCAPHESPCDTECCNPLFQICKVTTETLPDGRFQGYCESCPEGQNVCMDSSGMQQCKDLQNDSQNCGTCGNECSVGQECRNGSCVLIPTCSPGTKVCFSANGTTYGCCANLDATCITLANGDPGCCLAGNLPPTSCEPFTSLPSVCCHP